MNINNTAAEKGEETEPEISFFDILSDLLENWFASKT